MKNTSIQFFTLNRAVALIPRHSLVIATCQSNYRPHAIYNQICIKSGNIILVIPRGCVNNKNAIVIIDACGHFIYSLWGSERKDVAVNWVEYIDQCLQLRYWIFSHYANVL